MEKQNEKKYLIFNKEYNNLKFNIYKIEVGVLWTKDKEKLWKN